MSQIDPCKKLIQLIGQSLLVIRKIYFQFSYETYRQSLAFFRYQLLTMLAEMPKSHLILQQNKLKPMTFMAHSLTFIPFEIDPRHHLA